ncbi:hypothetical protein VTN96DRAFT_8911 [Rasamsonia emersonii]
MRVTHDKNASRGCEETTRRREEGAEENCTRARCGCMSRGGGRKRGWRGEKQEQDESNGVEIRWERWSGAGRLAVDPPLARCVVTEERTARDRNEICCHLRPPLGDTGRAELPMAGSKDQGPCLPQRSGARFRRNSLHGSLHLLCSGRHTRGCWCSATRTCQWEGRSRELPEGCKPGGERHGGAAVRRACNCCWTSR